MANDKNYEKKRRMIMASAIIGLIVGTAAGVFGTVMFVKAGNPQYGMLTLSLGLPTGLLVGALVGNALSKIRK